MLAPTHAAPAEGADSASCPQGPTRRAQTPRTRAVGVVLEFKAALAVEVHSQREFAAKAKVPRSTLQGWITAAQHAGVEPEVVAFFESPAGVRFLHRLFHALLFVMTVVGACGLRHVAMVLRLACLDRWIAPSHGSLHAASVRMETCVGGWGDAQRAALAPTMPTRSIALCEDETHHPAPCLVAIEPVSDFIVVERYATRRDAEAWNAAVQDATVGLRVVVEQVTSDLARGIRRHVRLGLHAQHNADIFHVQYDVTRATAAPLAAQQRRAAKALGDAQTAETKVRAAALAAQDRPRGRGRPVNWPTRIAMAAQEVQATREVLDEATTQRETMQADMRSLSASYHPFDLTTGAPRSSQTVGDALRATFSRLEERAQTAGLGERREALVAKAARVIPWLVATIAWVHARIAAKVTALSLPTGVASVVLDELIPGLYLLRVAGRARAPEVRDTLLAAGHALLTKAREGALRELPEAARRRVEDVARECATLFVASSACVEGRNGHLRLHLHHLHRLPARKLKALTVVHNFVITRPDGTTGAQRFFGSAHGDLFEALCATLPVPARPRQRRRRPDEDWLEAAA